MFLILNGLLGMGCFYAVYCQTTVYLWRNNYSLFFCFQSFMVQDDSPSSVWQIKEVPFANPSVCNIFFSVKTIYWKYAGWNTHLWNRMNHSPW